MDVVSKKDGHDDKLVRSANRKFFYRMIPLLVIMLIVNQIDRANIGFLKSQLAADAGIGAAAFGLGAGLFFVGYALFEVPSNMALDRYGARVWLTRIMVTWGAVVFLTGLVTSPVQFYIMRFLLGVAEAGFFPGILFYFRKWVPNIYRGRATALVISASAVANLVSGPITGLLLGINNVAGIAEWQWVLFIEGGVSVIMGAVSGLMLASSPKTAKWLTEAEKAHLSAVLEDESKNRDGSSHTISRWKLITEGRMLYLCAIFFTMTMTGYTLVFWLPEIVGRIKGFSAFGTGVLAAIPWLCAIIAINILGKVSDRYRGNRERILAIAILVAAAGTFIATFGNPWFGLLAMCVACVGSKSSASLYWPIPQAQLPTSIVAPGIALINSLGNLGGFIAPTVFGYIQQQTGSTTGGLYGLTAISVIAALTLLIVKHEPPKHEPASPMAGDTQNA